MNIEKFVKEDMGIRVRFVEEGAMELNCYDIAYGLFLKVEYKNGKEYESIRWSRLEDYVEDKSFAHYWSKENSETSWLPEGDFYKLIMKMRGINNEKVNKFQDWVAFEVLPSIRKNGYYLNENMSSEQYEKLQDELRIRNQQVDNFSNMIGGNTRKKQKLETFLKDMFPHIKDGYKQFLDSMVKAGSLDVNYNPTEVFIKINDERHIFTHTINTTNMVDTYLSLTNIGMVEMSKRLYEENGKIKLRKSEDKK